MRKLRYRFSVREFVNFIMRSGDLNNTYTGRNRALEGTYAHQAIQSRLSGHYGLKYEREVFLETEVDVAGVQLTLTGRADGIIHDDRVTIDEIKSTTKELKDLDDGLKIHWAQVEIYAYIYGLQNNLESIDVQLTYCDPESLLTKQFHKEWQFDDLSLHFLEMVELFKSWSFFIKKWTEIRTEATLKVDFPFDYRKGQRQIVVAVYRAIRDKNKLYIQAPTGIGKTMSVLFPAIKALGEGLTKKIFYLTAKTITRTVAEDSLRLLSENGLKLKAVTLTAKDKICFNKNGACNPEECHFAKGHFDRVNQTLYDMLQMHQLFDRDLIEKYGREYRVCPFELQLDLTEWADLVICDYNYVFDPRVYLKRFFDEKKESYSFLIDEAHNLVSRTRDMYSATIKKDKTMEIKRLTKGRSRELTKKLEKINRKFLTLRKAYGDSKECVMGDEPSELYGALREFVEICDGYLQHEKDLEIHKEVLDYYFEAVQFLKISELYTDAYRSLIKNPSKNELEVKLYCLDPSTIIKEIVKRNGTGIFFSATLLPLDYYQELLGGEKKDKTLELSSPFDKEHFSLMIAGNVSTRLKDRERSYEPITKYIHGVVESKVGNYMVFFPSYDYMHSVHDLFTERYNHKKTILQSSKMTESEREGFLEQFESNVDEPVIGFCVLGGIFSEGIDLRNDRLTGTMIIGVGLPRISLEQDLIRDYFEETRRSGYNYAYVYPGMTKVLQAAGRVIRTEEDRGVILLIGDRFNQPLYRSIYPRNWFPYTKIYNDQELKNALSRFW